MCNQFESITTEVKEPDSQEARTKLSIETREHGQEHSQTQARSVTITDVLVKLECNYVYYVNEFSDLIGDFKILLSNWCCGYSCNDTCDCHQTLHETRQD